MLIHVVKRGETIYTIAAQYGVTPYDIISTNELTNPDRLVPGQTLVILFPDQIYITRAGDTIYSIALANNTSVKEIYRNNPFLHGRPYIEPGWRIILSYAVEKRGTIEVNGFAYPYINNSTLVRALPYLTYLTPFTYGITPRGGLVPLDDDFLIASAKDSGVAPIMSLSTLTIGGGFSSEAANIVLNDNTARYNLVQNTLNNMNQKGYIGLGIDFEYIPPQDKDVFTEFVGLAAGELKPYGYFVVTAVAPKTSANQKGLLYEAHDYHQLGLNSDKIFVMTYEWGYTYGPPMAVAPIREVERVIKYAVTEISPDKIWMGIPNYGYDWALPYVQGETVATTVSNALAPNIALKYGVDIQFDERAQSPFIEYTDENGVDHEVWFEDARSIQAKLDLVSKYNLKGIGYWNLMYRFPQNWRVLNALYDIKDV